MPIVKVSFSDEKFHELEALAQEKKMSMPDYIREKLFPEKTIFTPEEAALRALNKFKPGDCFTIPALYAEEWTMKRGAAGVFGKRFFNFIVDTGCERIEFAGMTDNGRLAQYRIKEDCSS